MDNKIYGPLMVFINTIVKKPPPNIKQAYSKDTRMCRLKVYKIK